MEEGRGELSLSAQSSFTCPPSGISRNSLCAKTYIFIFITTVEYVLKPNNEQLLDLDHCGITRDTKKNKEEQMLRRLTFTWKIETIMLGMSLKYTSVTQSILCLIFLMYI